MLVNSRCHALTPFCGQEIFISIGCFIVIFDDKRHFKINIPTKKTMLYVYKPFYVIQSHQHMAESHYYSFSQNRAHGKVDYNAL